ncbi:MAG: hypothetical protein Q7R41_14590, partial [Phycisphaerales bacterium]|nr:hypothetical protein [Phycisphaerales bacterium]
ETTVEGGRELIESFNPEESRSGPILEAVDSSLFKSISGQVVYTEILEAYNAPIFLGARLARTVPTRLDGEKLPGVGAIGDQAQSVKEGKEYPEAGITADFIETPQTTKRGMIVSVTKETIFFDKTSLVLDRAAKVGEALGILKEKNIIDAVIGVTSTWNPQGKGALSSYSNSTGLHGFDNLANSNALATWANIDTALQLFDAITDPFTGEPIVIDAPLLLCGRALVQTARYVVNATEVRQDPNANAGTAQTLTIYNTPPEVKRLEILTNAYVGSRMTAGSVNTSSWILGDFQRAFRYMENWPITVTQSNEDSDAGFEKDIVVRFKASERGVAACVNARYVVFNSPA